MTDYMELWKCSFWLSDCPRSYAAHFYKKDWEAAKAHEGSQHWFEDLKDAAEEGKSQGYEGFELFAYSAAKVGDLGKPKHELLEKCTHELIQKLKSGKYRAFGFDRPRTLDLNPVQIPREAWARVTRLDDNRLAYQSLQFVDVRVRMMREEVDPILKQPLEAPVAKAGRPTVAPAIEAAFHALNKIKEIDLSASQMSHYPKVRKWLEMNGTNLPVPADKISSETIRRIISPLFKELKEAKKQ